MRPPANAPRRVVIYFAPDHTEVSTITRARGFLEHGFEIAVFAFRRGRYNPHFEAPWPEIELGRTCDGRYLHRLLKLMAALVVLWNNRVRVRRASVLYARNLDQLVLAVMARLLLANRARLVYEVLDIAAAFTRRDTAAAILRLIERGLLRLTDAMVVSSPAFLRNYYLPVQRYRHRTFVIENRLHASDVAAIEHSTDGAPSLMSRHRSYKWVIGYFGLIRGQRTFDLITRLAERFPDILFYFRGVVTTVDRQRFASAIALHENMIFGGPYVNPDDLKRLYGSVDFAWALDLEREDHNSRWLMPCRFYEASLIGVPCLVAQGFEVGDRVASLGIGWTLAPAYEESFVRLFAELTRSDYETVADRLTRLPVRMFAAGDDMAEFCRAMKDEDTTAAPKPAPPIRLPLESGRADTQVRRPEEIARRQLAGSYPGSAGEAPGANLTPPPAAAAP